MNRRLFLSALAGFAILPSAETYKRLWRATEKKIWIPEVKVDLFQPDYVFRFTQGSTLDRWKVETFSRTGLLVHILEMPMGVIPTVIMNQWYHWQPVGKSQWQMLEAKKD